MDTFEAKINLINVLMSRDRFIIFKMPLSEKNVNNLKILVSGYSLNKYMSYGKFKYPLITSRFF